MNNHCVIPKTFPGASSHLTENKDFSEKISGGDSIVKNNIPSAQYHEAPAGVFKHIKERSCHRLTVVVNRLKSMLTKFAGWVKISKGLFDVGRAGSCDLGQREVGSYQKTKSTNECIPKIHARNDDLKEEAVGNIQKLSYGGNHSAWEKFLIKVKGFAFSRVYKV